MMIYREQYYLDRQKPQERDENPDRVETAEINIAKHRNGDVGTVLLGFQPSYIRFMNLAAESKRQYVTAQSQQDFKKQRGHDEG